MNIKKFCLTLFSVLAILLVFKVNALESKAYYDIDNDLNIPKGGEFVYKDYIYRVVKTHKYRPEVEIVGLVPVPYKQDRRYLGIDDIEEEYGYKVVGIADNAFKDNQEIVCFSAESKYLRYIGKSAFEGCTNFRYFYDNGGVTTIKSRAFYGCKSLRSIELVHDRLKRVGKDAFRGTKKKFTVITDNMSKGYAPKVLKKLKKAGAKRIKLKMHFYKEYKGDPCH